MTNETEKESVAVLAEVTRGDVIESVHRGTVVVVDVEGRLVASAGNVDQLTYFRSAAKPFLKGPLAWRSPPPPEGASPVAIDTAYRMADATADPSGDPDDSDQSGPGMT